MMPYSVYNHRPLSTDYIIQICSYLLVSVGVAPNLLQYSAEKRPMYWTVLSFCIISKGQENRVRDGKKNMAKGKLFWVTKCIFSYLHHSLSLRALAYLLNALYSGCLWRKRVKAVSFPPVRSTYITVRWQLACHDCFCIPWCSACKIPAWTE